MKASRIMILMVLVVGMASLGAADQSADSGYSDSDFGSGDTTDSWYGFTFIPQKEGMTLTKVDVHDAVDGLEVKILNENSCNVVASATAGSDFVDFGSVDLSKGVKYTVASHNYEGPDPVSYPISDNDIEFYNGAFEETFDCSGIGSDNRDRLYTGHSVYYTINQAPQFNTSNIDPDPPLIGEASDVSYDVTDDSEVSNVTVEWFYDGNEQASTTTSYSSDSVSDTLTDFYTPQNTGNHTIYFTAVDDDGASTTETIEREVTDNPSSWASIIEPSEGQTYTADDEGTNDDTVTLNNELNPTGTSEDITFTGVVTSPSGSEWVAFDNEDRTTPANTASNFSGSVGAYEMLKDNSFGFDTEQSYGDYQYQIYWKEGHGQTVTSSDYGYTAGPNNFTVNEFTQQPDITLNNPNDGATFGYGPNESGANVEFDWVVDGYESDGNTKLYINGVEEVQETYSSFASNSFSYNDSFSAGTYEYYVEATYDDPNQAGFETVTSPTRTFTVEQQDIDIDFSLTEPSNNQVYNTAFDTDQTVNYDGGVSSDTAGTINLVRDGQILATESHPGSASVPISASEDLGEGLYDWFLEFEYESTEQQLNTRTVDFEDGDVDPFDVFGESSPYDNVFLEASDAISGGNSLYVQKGTDSLSTGESTQPDWDLGDDTDVDIDTVERVSFTTNPYELGSIGDADNDIYRVNVRNDNNDDLLQFTFEDTGSSVDLIVTSQGGDQTLKQNVANEATSIEMVFDESNMEAEVFVDGTSEGTFALDTGQTSLNVNEIGIFMDGADESSEEGQGALFDDFEVDSTTQQTVSETITSNSNSFEVVEDEAQDPVINLNNPTDGKVINLDPGTSNGNVTFDWSVEGYDETGNTSLYINGSEAFTDDFASLASNPYSYTENLSVGTYEYYIEASTDTRTVTSDTRSFTVNEQDMARPDFTLTEPEDNSELFVDGASSGEVDFEFGVSAETDGNVFLEVSEPGTNNYTSLYNNSHTGLTSASYNTSEEFTGIDYSKEYNGFNETESYNWRIRFESTETDDEFTSNSYSWTFTEEEVSTADGIVSGIVSFFGDYWQAFMDGTGLVGKAFIGITLMLIAGAIGFAAAGGIGAGLAMTTMFFVNTILGLFPGWIALALVITGLAYIFMFRGE